MKITTALLFGLALIGCATQPSFDYEPTKIENIGILVLIDDNLTHSHVGTTVFNNSTETHAAQTISPSSFLVARTTEILTRQAYNVTSVKVPADVELPENSFLTMGWEHEVVNPKHRELLERLIMANDVDLLLVFESFTLQDYYGGSSTHIDGYGLYTRGFLGNRFAKVYANVKGYGIYKSPIAYVDSGGSDANDALPIEVWEINSETAPAIEKKVQVLFEEIIQNTLVNLELVN